MCCSAILRSSTLCMCTLLLSPGDQLISNSSSPVYQLLLAAVGLSSTAKNRTIYTTKLLKVCSCCYDTTTLGAPVSKSVDISVTLVFLWRFSRLHINSGLGACTQSLLNYHTKLLSYVPKKLFWASHHLWFLIFCFVGSSNADPILSNQSSQQITYYFHPLLQQHQFLSIDHFIPLHLKYCTITVKKRFEHQHEQYMRVIHENRLAYVCPWITTATINHCDLTITCMYRL